MIIKSQSGSLVLESDGSSVALGVPNRKGHCACELELDHGTILNLTCAWLHEPFSIILLQYCHNEDVSYYFLMSLNQIKYKYFSK